MGTKEVLTEALSLLEVRGWTKGRYEDEDGCLCSIGALNAVVHGDPRYDANTEEWEVAHNALKAGAGIHGVPAWIYNDAPETTFEDVREMFTNAIELVSA